MTSYFFRVQNKYQQITIFFIKDLRILSLAGTSIVHSGLKLKKNRARNNASGTCTAFLKNFLGGEFLPTVIKENIIKRMLDSLSFFIGNENYIFGTRLAH